MIAVARGVGRPVRALFGISVAGVVLVALTGSLLRWRAMELEIRSSAFGAYRESGGSCQIVIPDEAVRAERDAANLMSTTLAAALARDTQAFPVVVESARDPRRAAILIGETKRARRDSPVSREPVARRPVSYVVTGREIVLHAGHREDVVAAVSVFLERTLGARWFMPGDLGREILERKELLVPRERFLFSPGYFSRRLGGTEGTEWARANRLLAVLPLGHTAADFTTPEVLASRPDFAPILNGRRVSASEKSPETWQPDLLAPGFAQHVAAEIARNLRADPRRSAVQFALNDANRFDQSARTLGAVSPVRYFRGRPDYSALFYRFLNEVADEVRRDFPDRFITTYAYFWTEDTPRFRVAPNVIPYLTADRSMWVDPVFAADDRALIARWGAVGPKFIALYDYLYGSPFFVPRPTLWAVTEPIPYAWAHGARAYYAEMVANWALDGPKAWLAAQLLWNPQLDPKVLIDEYYSRFWKEAAGPMRAFYGLCDEQWRNQPRPLRWVKYYRDEDQRRLFPPEVRQRLRDLLTEAAGAATSPIVRERVKFVADAFLVTEAFCRHDEVREEVARLNFSADPTVAALRDAWADYSAARTTLVSRVKALSGSFPPAIQPDTMEYYLRNDPRPRLAHALAARGALGSATEPQLLAALFAGVAPTEAELRSSGRECLVDPQLRTLRIERRHPFASTDWGFGTPWRGRSEPAERREVAVLSGLDGAQRVRYVGGEQETLSQWVAASPRRLYRASITLRGKVSPGSTAMLSLGFLNARLEPLGEPRVDRLPVGEWPDGVTLEIFARAPVGAAWVGIEPGLYHQSPGDWLECERPSLVELEPPGAVAR